MNLNLNHIYLKLVNRKVFINLISSLLIVTMFNFQLTVILFMCISEIYNLRQLML